MGDQPERKSLSVYDYSDPSIRHAWVAVLAYAGLRALGTIAGMVTQPGGAIWFVIDFALIALILGGLAFGIYKRSRVAVVLAVLAIAGTQLYVCIVLRSFSGTIVSVIVTGFLLRGAVRIFQEHRELREARS
jgi:hypothetical protein